jgi:hypothetical protein
MWLLDVNLPTALAQFLHRCEIPCDTPAGRGWRDLTNGALAEPAVRDGFRVILTRDRLFGESSRGVLAALPDLAIVIDLAAGSGGGVLGRVRGAVAAEANRADRRADRRVALTHRSPSCPAPPRQ